MCLEVCFTVCPRKASLILCLVVNTGLTAWTFTLGDDGRLWSLVFIFPCFMCLGLLFTPRWWMAAVLFVTAGIKLLASIAAGLLAGQVANTGPGTLAALGIFVYTFLSVLSGVAAFVDLWAGCTNIRVRSKPSGSKRVGTSDS